VNAFEYSVLHAVPRVDRGERINVGVIVYCQTLDYLGAATYVDAARLRALDPSVDVDAVCTAVDAIRAVCAGEGPSAASPKGDRFRWLTSPRSTVVQPGPVHAGMTDSPEAEQARLLDRLVR
jgi:hypothetical protein